MSLLARLSELLGQYREGKSVGDDVLDLISALLFTLGALAFGIGAAAIFGGIHG